jgi:hypothetical protein
MKQIHKQFLCLATAYLDMFIHDAKYTGAEIDELYRFTREECSIAHNRDMTQISGNTMAVANKVNTVLENKEIEGNVIALSLASLMILIEDDVFKGSKMMKATRLVNSIYADLERSKMGTEELNNSMKLIYRLRELG